FAGHDVARLQVLLQQHFYGGRNAFGFALFLGTHCRVGGGVGEAHAHTFDGGRHRIGGVHSATGPGSGYAVLDDALVVEVTDVPPQAFAIGFKGRNNVQILTLPAALFYRATITHASRPNLASPGTHITRHHYV